MNVLILDPIWSEAPKLFADNGFKVYEAKQQFEVERVDFVILRSCTTLDEGRLSELKNRGLKVVLRAGSGLDNIDLEYCECNGIEVKNFPGGNSGSVAEVTLSYMLSCAHKLYSANQEMRKGIFAKYSYLGKNLESSSVAFVGYGATAKATISLLQKLNVKDIRVNCRSDVREDINGIRFVSLQDCFKADIVSLNIPLNDETYHLVNDDVLSKARDGLILINISRRGVVAHKALLQQLKVGKVAYYACDVLDPESDNELINNKNVFATPHLGAQSIDCQSLIAHSVLETMMARKRKYENI